MYVDSDGDTILETPAEIKRWIRTGYNGCHECLAEAWEFLKFVEGEIVLMKVVFSTTCTHAR